MSPEDTLRQHSFVILGRLQSGTEDVVNLDVALAAVAAEREASAKECEQEHNESGEHPEMALHCADRIRARQEPQG